MGSLSEIECLIIPIDNLTDGEQLKLFTNIRRFAETELSIATNLKILVKNKKGKSFRYLQLKKGKKSHGDDTHE